MIPYPEIDPVIFGLGPLKVRWYGLMYVLGFTATHLLVGFQARKYNLSRLAELYENLNFTLILSLILGARLGYIVFYNLPYYLQNPGEIIAVWQGGMSFHGALAGLLVGGWWFCRKNNLAFLETADIYAVTAPIGLGLGRLGNFINGELFGRVTDVPWAMVFPAGGPLPRHPSQIYEFLLEGLLLFSILWSLRAWHHRYKWPNGTLFAVFLSGYGAFRFLVELVREPDAQLGLIVGPLTMGQILSSIMLLAGITIFFLNRRKSLSG